MNKSGSVRRFYRLLLVVAMLLPLIACGKLKHNPPVITSAADTTFIIGTAGSFTVTANSTPASTFTLSAASGGTVPTWLTLNSTSGILSGTPPAGSAGTYNLVITAANGNTPNATQNFTLTVTAASTAILIVNDGTSTTAGVVNNLVGIVAATSGFSVSSVTAVPTSDLGIYKEIWDVRYNNTALSATDVSSYTTYVQGGGTLVLLGGPGPSAGFDVRNNSIINLISSLGGGLVTVIPPGSLTQTVLAPFNSPNSIPNSNVTFSQFGGTTISNNSSALMTTDATNIGTAIFFDKGKLTQATSGRLIAIFDFGFLNGTVATNAALFTQNIIQLQ
ncbi:MAG TPA: Ig domain-containing protein [Geobacteraceae bacterium]|nr:Ig domain-containing protein [Geobacteraceae bacterium]